MTSPLLSGVDEEGNGHSRNEHLRDVGALQGRYHRESLKTVKEFRDFWPAFHNWG